MAVCVLEFGSLGEENCIALRWSGGWCYDLAISRRDGLMALVLSFLANRYDETQTLKVQLALSPVSSSQHFISICMGSCRIRCIIQERFRMIVETTGLDKRVLFTSGAPATCKTQTESNLHLP
jgi:hypothetical protein